MFEFSQMSAGSMVSGWAKHLFLIRYLKVRYDDNMWNIKGYDTNYRGGVNIGDAATNFKLQLIM